MIPVFPLVLACWLSAQTLWAGDTCAYGDNLPIFPLPAIPPGGKQLMLRFIAGGRSLARLEIAPTSGEPVRLNLPNLRSGVTLKGVVTWDVLDASGRNLLTEQRTLHLFGRPWLQTKTSFLKRRGIDALGFTPFQCTQFREEGIPVDRVESIDAEPRPGRWLLCRSMDIDRQPDLFEKCLRAAQDGRRVLVFPPWSGIVPFPDKGWSDLRLTDDSWIKLQDARLDRLPQAGSLSWAQQPDGRPALRCDPGTDGQWAILSVHIGEGWLVFSSWDLPNLLPQEPSAARLLELLLMETADIFPQPRES